MTCRACCLAALVSLGVASFGASLNAGISTSFDFEGPDEILGPPGGTASGEFFCSHSIRLKQRSRLPHTFFLGYCNDYQQYFPTIEAAAEGGYGADAMVSPAPIGAGEFIINRGLFHLYNMQNKFRFGLLD